MEYGFVKVRAFSPQIRVGDAQYNAERIVEAIKDADGAGVELLVLPELCLSGATCGDLFLQNTLIEGCKRELACILEETKECQTLVLFGMPFALGAEVYNCAVAMQSGQVLALIPNGNADARYFATTKGLAWFDLFGKEIFFGENVILRADGDKSFTVACEFGDELFSVLSPSERNARAGANIIVNLSASAELVERDEMRRLHVQANSNRLLCGYVFANAGFGESGANSVYAAHQLIAEKGKLLAESKPFTGGFAESEIDTDMLVAERRKNPDFAKDREEGVDILFTSFGGKGSFKRMVRRTPFVPNEKELAQRAELILNMQAHALAQRLAHVGAKTAVIGVSGGLDSTLAFLVTVRAFDLLKKDKKYIYAYTMPGFGTTARTKNNSLALMHAMGATAKTVDITPSVKQHFADVEHDEKLLDTTYENAQARMRTMILMDIANKTGGIVVGTGDMSELALGWCTYNGDHMSNYAVNASVPKTLVKALCAYEGKRLGGEVERIVASIVETEISPELLPPDQTGNIAQKTEDLVGPYELHDFYLYYTVRYGFSPKKIYFLAKRAFGESYSSSEIKKWLKKFYQRFFTQQFKRSCSPDGVRVGSVSLSPNDWQMPSDAFGALWLREVEQIEE